MISHVSINSIITDIMLIYPNNQNNFCIYCLRHVQYHFHLIVLVIVASLVLFGSFKMRKQLSVRHPTIFNPFKTVSKKTKLSILNLEEWAERETLDFHDEMMNSIENIEHRIPKRIHPIKPAHMKELERKQEVFSKTVIDGIFWSSEVEEKMPSGPSDQQTFEIMNKLRFKTVQHLVSLKCGRNKNRLVLFEDGSKACCRYRDGSNVNIQVQGELMSFYLGRLLGISNIPVVVLSETNSSQWNKFTQAYKEKWTEVKKGDSATVALIEWLPNLNTTVMPRILLRKLHSNESKPNPLDGLELERLPISTLRHVLIDLVQWSDLIIFDYLIGHYDRAALMQMPKKILKSKTHDLDIKNLGKNSETNLLWLFDNESGLIAGYNFLYSENAPKNGNQKLFLQRTMNGTMFQAFHQKMVETNCIFRRKTVKRLYALYKSSNPSQLLLDLVSGNEPLFTARMPTVPETSFFMQHFKDRIHMLWKWIKLCQLNSNKY